MVDPVTVGTIAGAALGGGVAISKLLDVAKSGIGAVARPWMIKRDARANAEAEVEANKIREAGRLEAEAAMRKALPPAPDLEAPRSGELTKAADAEIVIDVDLEEVPPLAHRTEQRLTYQEEKRQLNVESVIREAAEELKAVQEVSDEKVDDDWTARFFTNVQDVSNERMRKLWAKILAGEVKKPGSFSLRTLEALKDMSQNDADGFVKIARMATHEGVVLRTDHASAHLSMRFMLDLTEAGLFTSGPGLGMNHSFVSQGDGLTFTTTVRDVVIIAKHTTVQTEPQVGMWALTRVGNEIAKVVVSDADIDQVRAIVEMMNERGFTATAHQITEWKPGGASYSLTPMPL